MRLADAAKMTDRERILTAALLWSDDARWFGLQPKPQPSPAQPGDLVRCNTTRAADRWAVAWFVADHGIGRDGYAVLRDIGSEATVRMYNESLHPIRGIPPRWLLEGHQFRAYVLAEKAAAEIRKASSTGRRAMLRSVEFADRRSRDAVAVFRPHAWFAPREPGIEAVPVRVSFHASSRTRLRDLVAAADAALPGDGEPWPVTDAAHAAGGDDGNKG